MKYNETTSKYITNYYSVKKYNDNYFELVIMKRPVRNKGFEDVFKSSRSKSNSYDFKLDNNISRARSNVFEYALCNDFKYFVTLTLNKAKMDRYDLGQFIKKLGQFIRDYRKKHGVNIQYLLIPEKHDDGAWHLHGLMKGIPPEHLGKNKNGYKDWKAYSERFGYISIDEIRNKEAVSKYITKYISKSFNDGKGVTEKHKKMYYVSRGLKKSKKILEGSYSLDFNSLPFQPSFENEYVIKREFNNIRELKKVINSISQ